MLAEFDSLCQERIVTTLNLQKKLAVLVDTQNYKALLSEATKSKNDFRHRFVTSHAYSPSWLITNTSKVFFDIEGCYLENGEHGFGMATSVNDKGERRYWKRTELGDLIGYLLYHEEVITFAGLEYDNWVIANEVGLDSPLIKQLYDKSFDLQKFAAIISPVKLNRRVSLESFARSVLGEGKTDLKQHGIERSKIPVFLKSGTLQQKQLIAEYCMNDSFLLYKLYQFFQINRVQKAAVLDQLVRDAVLSLNNWCMPPLVYDEDGSEDIYSVSSEGRIRPFGKSLSSLMYPNEFPEFDIPISEPIE